MTGTGGRIWRIVANYEELMTPRPRFEMSEDFLGFFFFLVDEKGFRRFFTPVEFPAMIFVFRESGHF